ncbi:MAG: hypothetical protein OET44_13045 [Gammaproteobacteria bacterium]|nr:hypothetical protein [Gammaproteobacteria bacterium]
MFEDEMHEMKLLKRGVDDSEEWLCAECGRRMVLKVDKGIERIVKVPGDEQARHYGGKFGISMNASLATESPDSAANAEGHIIH